MKNDTWMKRLLLPLVFLFPSLLSAQTWTWNSKNGPFGATVNSMAANSGGPYFIATNSGLFSSTDGGNTWAKASISNTQGFASVAVSTTGTAYAMQYYFSPGFAGIYSSTDGISWSLLSSTGLVSGLQLSKIAVAPKGYIYVVIANSGQLYRSTNSGSTFSALPVTFGSYVNDIAIDANNNVIVATQSSGVQVSTTDGISFNAVGTGLSTSATVYSLALDASNNIYALTSTGPYRSANTGSSWTAIKGTIADASFSGLIRTDGSGNLYVINTTSQNLYSSSNPTATTPAWTAGANVNASNTNGVFSAYFQTSTLAFLGRYVTGVDKSTNGGSTWSSSSTGIKGLNGSVHILQTSPSGRLFCASNGMKGYFLSIDDGSTWNLINSGSANTILNGFVKLNDGSILGYGPTGAIRTANEGTSWTTQNSTTALNTVVTSDGINLFSPSSSTDVLVSTNQGVTWTAKGITGIGTNSIQSIVPDNAGNLYLNVYNPTSSNYEMWKVNSGNTTAAKLGAYPGSGYISDIKTVGTNIYVASNALIYKSTTGGTSWTTLTVPTVGNVTKIFFYDDLNIIIQTNLGVYNTNNGGSSWQVTPLQDAPSATLSDLFFGADQSAYAATNNSVVQKSSTPVILPAAPTGLAITAQNVESVDLVFTDNANNETAYLLEASIGNNTSYQQVASYTGPFNGPQGVVALNDINSGIVADSTTVYYFRVRATNLAGNSSYSNEVSGNGLKNCTSSIPDNRSWTAIATADPGSTASGAGPFKSTTVLIQKIANTKNNFTVSLYDFGLTPGTFGPYTHYPTSSAVFVETCGVTYFGYDNTTQQDAAHGNGTWNGSNTLVLKWQTDPNQFPLFQGTTTFTLNSSDPVPAAPSLNAYVFSSSSNLLLWNSVPFATQYSIQRSTTSGVFTGPPIATVNYPAVQYTDTGLTPGTTYYYLITAKNAAGSTSSVQATITTASTTLFSPVQNNMALNTDSQQGVCWADLDGDGDEDYISPSFSNAAGQNSIPVFYENVGGGQFNRRAISVLQGENVATYRGANAIDINNDGKLDVYFPRTSGNTLADIALINNGAWNFTKISINQTARANGFRASSFADYDRDGLADLYVADSDPTNLSFTTSSLLLKNTSAGGAVSFNQITNGSIVTNSVESRDLSWADFNNDGLQDLFVTSYNSSPTTPNPNIPNRLYKNNGDGTFTQVTGTVFDTDVFFGARTSSWGDIDNDGDLDLYIGSQNKSVADRLYQNNGNGTFTSLTTSAVAETGTSTFGSAFGDIDNDGDLDLIAINYNNTANSIFINGGTGNFTKSNSNELLTYVNLLNIGGAFVDYDQNGYLDISTGRSGSSIPPYLFQNQLSTSSSRNWVEVKLTGSVSNTVAIGARITVTTISPARTQIREISARTGYGSQNSLIQHFGLGSASTISQIQVKWPNGGVQTLTNPGINQIIIIPEVLTGPTFSGLSPSNGATNASVSTTLSLTLSASSKPVTSKNINVYLTSNTTTPVFSIPVTNGTAVANTYTFTLPQSLSSAVSYSVSVDAGAFVDIYGNATLALPSTSWQFTTSDLIPPVITFTPVSTLPKASLSTSSFVATATDNVSVASVVMSYRKITFTQFQTLAGTAGTSNQYNFPLQSAYFDDMGIEYFFTATDPSGNSVRSPTTGTYTTRLTFDGAAAATVGVSAGSQVSDYTIISVPLDLTSNDVSNIFSAFGVPDITRWRLLSYQFNPQTWLQYPKDFSTVARGDGYFVISLAGKYLVFQGATAPNYNQSNLFMLSLQAGYNLIGNPYTVPINWDDSKVSGVNSIKVFQNGNYTDGNTIQPYSGGFVFAQNAVTVPVKMQINPGSAKKDPSNGGSRDAAKWVVQIQLVQANRQFNFGGVGMAANASYSYDEYDDFAPPSPFGVFQTDFSHTEHFMKNFSKDVVPLSAGYTWKFDVNSELTGDVTLNWDNASVDADLYLFDVALQRPIDMRAQSTYVIDPRTSKNFYIYYGTDVHDQLKPQMIFLGQAYPNPSSGITTIPFNLPEGQSSYNVKIEVFDVLGNLVSTVLNKQLMTGFYNVTWDATTSNAANGLYVYRAQVEGNGLHQTLGGKIILNK